MKEFFRRLRRVDLTIPNVYDIFSTPIPAEIGPKEKYLTPWFNYFVQELGLKNGLLDLVKKEFTAAHVLKQAAFDWGYQNIALKDRNELDYMGIDPARILRYLILQAAYPNGIQLNHQIITLSLESKNGQLDQLLGIIKKIPSYEKLNKYRLEKLIKELGFSKNPAAEGYSCSLKQNEFQVFLQGIIHTYSR